MAKNEQLLSAEVTQAALLYRDAIENNSQYLLNYFYERLQPGYEGYLSAIELCHLLHWAILLRQPEQELVKLLERMPQAVNMVNVENGDTFLHLAVIEKNLTAVRVLLQHKASANVANLAGEFPLHTAIQQGDVASVIALVQAGANVNIPNNQKQYPIHLAIYSNNAAIVQAILTKNVNLNLPDANHDRALLLAVKMGNVAIVELIFNKRTDRLSDKNALIQAVVDNQIEIVKFLLENGISANAEADGMLRTALFYLTSRLYPIDEIAMAKVLLQNKADINKLDCNNCTPLFSAIANGKFELANFLLSQGATVYKVNAEHFNSLKISQLVVLAYDQGYCELAEALLQAAPASWVPEPQVVYAAETYKRIDDVKPFLDNMLVKQSSMEKRLSLPNLSITQIAYKELIEKAQTLFGSPKSVNQQKLAKTHDTARHLSFYL